MSAIRTAKYKDDLSELVGIGDDLSFAVAYVTQDGLELIRPQLIQLLEQGRNVRILLDLQSGNTDPSAVWDILAIVERFNTLHVKTFVPGKDEGIIHSKLYIAHSDKAVTFMTGSANLTGAALNKNQEHGVRVHGAGTEAETSETLAVFQKFWDAPQSKVIDEEAARLYEAYCGRLRKAQLSAGRRSRSAWNALVDHLSKEPTKEFSWPSEGAAYVMGAIAARGKLITDRNLIEIKLLFNASSYKGGMISVRGTTFDAAKVLPTIPLAIAARARDSIPGASVTQDGQKVLVDLTNDPTAFHVIREAYAPRTNCDTFRLPKGLLGAQEPVVSEFVRGFAVACALLTDHTSMPGNKRTGLPGQMVVWLRPKQSNEALFHSFYSLLMQRLGVAVYRHERIDRDPHLKIRCEDFEEKIGFGIDWWDELVRAGAAYNFRLFPQLSLTG